jgi:molecular chaperone HtpG
MTSDRVPVGINFRRVLETISAQIYDTPMAFLRENVQNAVDALRMYRAEVPQHSEAVSVSIELSGATARITDTGVGMSRTELQDLFWTMGASGKNTPLARQAGCVGHFGVGGFANFGVCRTLTVTSKHLGHDGWKSKVSVDEIPASGVPEVVYILSEETAPHGTIVEAELTTTPNLDELRAYLTSFVRFVPESITFNGILISQTPLTEDEGIAYGVAEEFDVSGTKFEGALGYDAEKIPVVKLTSGNHVGGVGGVLRFASGTLEVFKRGFKLCSTATSSTLGVRGRFESDILQPTAGRDSLSAPAQQFVAQLVHTLELAVAREVVKDSDLIAANPRIVPFAVANLGIESVGLMPVKLADGTDTSLQAIRDQVTTKNTPVYFGRSGDRDVLQILQASGNMIMPLSGDAHWQSAQRSYLSTLCGAKSFEGLIQIKEPYTDLSTFEVAFLAEVESAVRYRYEIVDFQITPAAITGGIPAFASAGSGRLSIYIDVKHPEVAKLKPLGISPVLYSMATEFCREYLSSVLKLKSPKFFGSGALNIDEIMKRRAELWRIETADIAVDTRGEVPHVPAHFGGFGVAQVVTTASIMEVEVGAPSTEIEGMAEMAEPQAAPIPGPGREQKILKIVDLSGNLGIGGYYFRIMDAPAKTFGNEIQTMTEVFALWFGNKVTYVFSDGVGTAFQYELRFNAFIKVDGDAGGTMRLAKPLQGFATALFVQVPEKLEPYIIPASGKEILVTVNYDWIDLSRGTAILASGVNTN